MKPIYANTLWIGGGVLIGLSCWQAVGINWRPALVMLGIVLEFILAWAIIRESIQNFPNQSSTQRLLEILLPLLFIVAGLARIFGFFGPPIL